MIVYHVHYNANAVLVKCITSCLNSLILHLGHKGLWNMTLKAVEVLRVITPVILIEPRLALVYSGIIFHREQVNMGYAKLFEMFDTGVHA